MRLRLSWGKILVVLGGVTLASALGSFSLKAGSGPDTEKYDVVIANGHAARAPIS
jgi:hypothetical protein